MSVIQNMHAWVRFVPDSGISLNSLRFAVNEHTNTNAVIYEYVRNIFEIYLKQPFDEVSKLFAVRPVIVLSAFSISCLAFRFSVTALPSGFPLFLGFRLPFSNISVFPVFFSSLKVKENEPAYAYRIL